MSTTPTNTTSKTVDALVVRGMSRGAARRLVELRDQRGGKWGRVDRRPLIGPASDRERMASAMALVGAGVSIAPAQLIAERVSEEGVRDAIKEAKREGGGVSAIMSRLSV